jgi:hypothetical protein
VAWLPTDRTPRRWWLAVAVAVAATALAVAACAEDPAPVVLPPERPVECGPVEELATTVAEVQRDAARSLGVEGTAPVASEALARRAVAVEAVRAVAPPEVGDALGVVFGADGTPPPETAALASKVVTWALDTCGINPLEPVAVSEALAEPSRIPGAFDWVAVREAVAEHSPDASWLDGPSDGVVAHDDVAGTSVVAWWRGPDDSEVVTICNDLLDALADDDGRPVRVRVTSAETGAGAHTGADGTCVAFQIDLDG